MGKNKRARARVGNFIQYSSKNMDAVSQPSLSSEISELKPRIFSNNLKSDTLNIDKDSNFVDEIVQKPSSFVPVKTSSRRKKIIIFAVIISAILLIALGIILYFCLRQQQNSEDKKEIKIPEDYIKYKDTIQKGQENNLVEIIYVPKSQKIYEYTLTNQQTVVQGDGQTSKTTSKIVHTFGILCTGITDQEFEVILYLMDTKKYDNDKIVSTLTGFPDMIKLENRRLRLLDQTEVQTIRIIIFNQIADENSSSQINTNVLNNSEQTLMNEYAPLNEDEIKILAEKGITKQMFDFSHYPIIKFSILKKQINSQTGVD